MSMHENKMGQPSEKEDKKNRRKAQSVKSVNLTPLFSILTVPTILLQGSWKAAFIISVILRPCLKTGVDILPRICYLFS